MIALMNYALLLIVLTTIGLSWKFKSKNILLVGLFIAIVYSVAQPTMLPKGTVAAPVIKQLEYVDKSIVDRSLKPMSDAERDARRNAALKEINDNIENTIAKEKQ